MHEGPIQSESQYRAYLVRLWQDSPHAPWRALARDVETGEERRFATVEHLFLFLHRRTEGAEPEGITSDGGRNASSHVDGCESEGVLEES